MTVLDDDSGSPIQLLPLRLATLSVARMFAHIVEHGSNRGPAVEFFLRCTQVAPGAPWCAAFVNACAEIAAALRNQEPSPLEQVERQAYVADYVTWATDHGLETDDPTPGDIFCIWFPSEGRHAHMGLAQRTIGSGPGPVRYATIEGNSNERGAREGRKVIVRERRQGANDVFIRWTE